MSDDDLIRRAEERLTVSRLGSSMVRETNAAHDGHTPGPDGWLTTNRCVGYDPDPAVRGDVWAWTRIRWEDARLHPELKGGAA